MHHPPLIVLLPDAITGLYHRVHLDINQYNAIISIVTKGTKQVTMEDAPFEINGAKLKYIGDES
jgi:hypothetical protein